MRYLADRRLPEAEIQTVQRIFDSDPNVLGYHKLRTRKSGSVRHIDAHVLMDDNLTLVRSHELTEQLEAKVRKELTNSVVTLHIEPYQHEQEHQRKEHGGPPADQKITPSATRE